MECPAPTSRGWEPAALKDLERARGLLGGR